MNSSDRKFFSAEFRRGVAMLHIGDRAGTIALLRRLQALVTGREPELPERIDDAFTCERTGCERMRASACIHRQRVAEAQTNQTDPQRGQSSEYPNCQGCPQGAAIRARLDPEREAFVGVGPHHRRERARTLRDPDTGQFSPNPALERPVQPAAEPPRLDTPSPPVPTADVTQRRSRRRRRKARVSGRGR